MGRAKVFNNVWHVEEINSGEYLITNTKADMIAELDDKEYAEYIVGLHNTKLRATRGF